MINHVSIGVADVARAKAFYDAALKPLGYTCLSSDEKRPSATARHGRAVDRSREEAG